MKKPPPADNFFSAFFILSLAFFAFAFCACSDEPVKIDYSQAFLLLDFQNEEDPPVDRMGVFLGLSTNVRRVDNISVRNSEFAWKIESPIMLETNDRQWIGSSSLEPPQGLNADDGFFPTGSYSIECIDAAGKDAYSNFTLSYNVALLSAKAGEVESIVSNASKRIAVYSESNELLYFDAPKEEWVDDKDVFKRVKNSHYFRRTLTSGNVICFMPKIYKDGEKPDGLE